MKPEYWEHEESRGWCRDYRWWHDDREDALPTRKFYLFLAEIGRRLRHFMTDGDTIKMIGLCEQCGEGQISEDDISDAALESRSAGGEDILSSIANDLFFWVADRYKVASDTFVEGWVSEIFAIQAAIEAKLIERTADAEAVRAICNHPIYVAAHERTELEWGALIRDIYGPNPFIPVASEPEWRSDTALSLAKHFYESRDFSQMPILADALQDAGCDNADIPITAAIRTQRTFAAAGWSISCWGSRDSW